MHISITYSPSSSTEKPSSELPPTRSTSRDTSASSCASDGAVEACFEPEGPPPDGSSSSSDVSCRRFPLAFDLARSLCRSLPTHFGRRLIYTDSNLRTFRFAREIVTVCSSSVSKSTVIGSPSPPDSVEAREVRNSGVLGDIRGDEWAEEEVGGGGAVGDSGRGEGESRRRTGAECTTGVNWNDAEGLAMDFFDDTLSLIFCAKSIRLG